MSALDEETTMTCSHYSVTAFGVGKRGKCNNCGAKVPARPFVDAPPKGYKWGNEHDGAPLIVKLPRETKAPKRCRHCGSTRGIVNYIRTPTRFECRHPRACERRRIRARLDAAAQDTDPSGDRWLRLDAALRATRAGRPVRR